MENFQSRPAFRIDFLHIFASSIKGEKESGRFTVNAQKSVKITETDKKNRE